ncbi:hypothetical protein ACS0TY_017960 [Phlomoides rotata]
MNSSVNVTWELIGREDSTMIYNVTTKGDTNRVIIDYGINCVTVARNLRNVACCVAIAYGYYKLISEQSEETRKILEEGHDRDSLAVKELTLKKIQQTSVESAAQSMTILDPKRSTKKGRKARLKNHFQRSKKRSSAITREFGTQTLNTHLF